VQAIADITVNQGIDPSVSNLIGGGGAAGLNAVAIAERLGCQAVIIPEVGAGLSAAGAISSDVGRSFRRLFVANALAFDVAGVGAVLDGLVAEANNFAAEAGVESAEARIDLFAEARYAHQVWEIDVAINDQDMRGTDS
ncbi:hydantoinase/oxoprolinase family protein, partial [Mesorhizobium sp. M2A.F.Ca.ET.040.01.1.1]